MSIPILYAHRARRRVPVAVVVGLVALWAASSIAVGVALALLVVERVA